MSRLAPSAMTLSDEEKEEIHALVFSMDYEACAAHLAELKDGLTAATKKVREHVKAAPGGIIDEANATPEYDYDRCYYYLCYERYREFQHVFVNKYNPNIPKRPPAKSRLKESSDD